VGCLYASDDLAVSIHHFEGKDKSALSRWVMVARVSMARSSGQIKDTGSPDNN
jgi:hypothetical protein